MREIDRECVGGREREHLDARKALRARERRDREDEERRVDRHARFRRRLRRVPPARLPREARAVRGARHEPPRGDGQIQARFFAHQVRQAAAGRVPRLGGGEPPCCLQLHVGEHWC